MYGWILCIVGIALVMVGGSMIDSANLENFRVLFAVIAIGAMCFGIGAGMFND